MEFFSPLLSWNHVVTPLAEYARNNQTAWQNHPWLTGHLVIFPSWAFLISPLLQVCQTARRPDARRGDDRQATRQRMVPQSYIVQLLTPNRTGCIGPHYWFTSTASPKSIPILLTLYLCTFWRYILCTVLNFIRRVVGITTALFFRPPSIDRVNLIFLLATSSVIGRRSEAPGASHCASVLSRTPGCVEL